MNAQDDMALEGPETAAEAPQTPGEGVTRTPPVPPRDGHEKVDAFGEWYNSEYGDAWADTLGVSSKRYRQYLRRAFAAGQRTPRPKPARVPQDTDQLGDAVARLVRAVARRGQEGDLEGLTQVLRLQAECRSQLPEVVSQLHHEHGYSWADIGRAAGISRQAAEQRWG